jgi:nitrate reductase beta subunit
MLAAARRSPVYALIKDWRLALPLHPEFRTLPMVWYVPPLSPISSQVDAARESDTIDHMRIPMAYLANLLTAGDEAPVRMALKRLAAVRHYMRVQRVENRSDTKTLDAVGLDEATVAKMYRLLALARLEDRFVLPTRPMVGDETGYTRQGYCGFGNAM